MIGRIDRWFGTRIMQPPIVKLCQLTGMTQFAVSRYAWMAACFTLVMRIDVSSASEIIWAVIITLVALLNTLQAALIPDRPTSPFALLRRAILFFSALDLVLALAAMQKTGSLDLTWRHAWDCLALVGEYAKTINTIPPRRTREPRRRSIQQGG